MPVSQITLPSCGSLQYYDSDESSKTCLVILGASPSDIRDYDGIKSSLEAKFRLITLNWPGFGGSTLDNAAIDDGALFLHQIALEFLEALTIPPAIFIGVAVGAYCACRIALERPKRVLRLALVSPVGFAIGGPLARLYAALMGSKFAPKPVTYAKSYLGHKEKPLVKQMLERAATLHSAPAAVSMIRSVWRSLSQTDCDLTLKATRIKIPVLLIFGKNDPIVPPSKDGKVAKKAFGEGAGFVVLEARHLPFAEIPDEFLKSVMPFLCEEEDLL